jgi:sporulation protein YunB
VKGDDTMRRFRKRRRKKPLLIWVIIISVILFSIFRTERALRPYAQLQAEHFAEKTANEIIEQTVSSYLERNKFTYNDFAIVLYDDNKKANSIETIPYTINKVQSDLTLLINKELEHSGSRSALIPLGTLTDSFLLTGKGPKIKIKVAPMGVAAVELKSEFNTSGINQTVHRISAVISTKMSSSTPLYSFDVVSEFELILAENVIVGAVPDISPYTIK